MAQGLQRDLDTTGKVIALKQPSPLLMVRLETVAPRSHKAARQAMNWLQRLQNKQQRTYTVTDGAYTWPELVVADRQELHTVLHPRWTHHAG